MNRRITIDDLMRAKLGGCEDPVTICSADGKILGYFTPASPNAQSTMGISTAELLRRLRGA